MAEFDHLTLERTDDVARVTMHRPETHNAMNPAMASELRTATADLYEDDSRCVVLTGADGVFNTGADLSVLSGDASDGRTLRSIASSLHRAIENLSRAPKPVITGINGVAAGGGFGLALAGDIVLLAEDARLEFAYPRVGLTGDAGSTFLLPKLVGLRRAKEIALLDETISPERAVEMGLATEVASEFDDRLAELAAELADGPTRAYGATKRLFNRSAGRDLSAQMAAETDTIARMTATDDYRRGLDAFFGDEEPAFEGE
ncbi:enoyl-CoA hydratase [Haladaptatus paucihalophilus DX253]|uniref:Enoyl-CoA hydratase n=1 Tax=Haladaptatus paucihalophilus DX253 TaxID=797209 RepID=E7QQI4_HALPU|nr:enoyl-CoA hydratase/isomerase family protein [Haladaptatus paucihalophilus]EFW93248.1 enoyl-CoA hydratase [Haladaptatus paucihalophilus DX253]SHK49213.1 Enoyl-CoA hydratase [Haladaptatus paucihalophilus DX253]